ncbi:MAG: hypothetical protein IPM91_16570 [Bacteroidetes bacterium]|nr:hypothetical protein [Bacteroidota bacterium]
MNAPGVTATYSLRYAGDENTTAGSVSGGTFNVQQWNGSNFTKVNSTGNGVTTGIGTITATLNNVSGPSGTIIGQCVITHQTSGIYS